MFHRYDGLPRPSLSPARITLSKYRRAFGAGATLLAFENHRTVRHEMSVALLKVGLAPDSVLQAITRGTRRRDFVEGQAALIIAAPGEPSGPRLWLNLQKGRTYVVLCTLRDSPDQPQHTSLGMIGSFRPD